MVCSFDRTNRNELTVETRKLLLSPFRNKRPPPSRNGNEIGKNRLLLCSSACTKFILNLMTSDRRVCTYSNCDIINGPYNSDRAKLSPKLATLSYKHRDSK